MSVLLTNNMDACWALIICITFPGFLTTESKWTNVNGTFVNPALPWTLWPNNEVPFYIDNFFAPAEVLDIRTAIQTVATNLDECIRFVEVAQESPVFKLRITPSTNDRHGLSNRCRTYPGKIASLEKAGLTEQPMVLVNGSTGCLGQGFRPLLKYFALVLGKRNEHQRPNRDEFLHINHDNLDDATKVTYKMFPERELFSTCSEYDYCSVTHNQATDFTLHGSIGFIVKKEPYFIPQLDHLSECDCLDIKTMYGCTPTCKKLNCAAQKMQPAPLERQQPCRAEPVPVTTHSLWTSVQSTPTFHQICYTMPVTNRAVTRTVSTRIEPTVQSRQGNSLCQVTAQTGMGNSGVPLSISFTMRQKRNIMEGTPAERALNFDPKFVKWPGNTVPYYLDPSFSPDEQKRIKDAFAQVSTELRGCVVFSEVPATASLFKVKVTPTEAVPGTFPTRGCHTFPGASRDRIGIGKNEQEMLVRNGPNGCANDIQMLLRLAAMILGKRYEHQRQDRDDALLVNPTSIGPEMRTMFDKYSFQNASLFCGYDYCSVTHIRADEFSTAPGVPAFTVKNAPLHIPRLNKLSECDCKEISFLYNCPIERCIPTNCASIPPPTSPSITGPNVPVPGSPGTNQNQPIPPSNPIPHNLSIPTSNPQNVTPSITISIPMNVSPGPDGNQVQVCYTLPAQSMPISFTVNPGMSIGMSMGNLQTLVTLNGCSNTNVPPRPDWPIVTPVGTPFPPRPTVPVFPEISTAPTTTIATTVPLSTLTSMQTSTSAGISTSATSENPTSVTPTLMTSAGSVTAPGSSSIPTTVTPAPLGTTIGSAISNTPVSTPAGSVITSTATPTPASSVTNAVSESGSTLASSISISGPPITSPGMVSSASTVSSVLTGTAAAVTSVTAPTNDASSSMTSSGLASVPTQGATTATTSSNANSALSTTNPASASSMPQSATAATTTNKGDSSTSTLQSGSPSSMSQGVTVASTTSSGSTGTISASTGRTQSISVPSSTGTSASGSLTPSLVSTAGVSSTAGATTGTTAGALPTVTTAAPRIMQLSTVTGQSATGTIGTSSTVSQSTGAPPSTKVPIAVDDHRAEVDPAFFEYAFRSIDAPHN